MAVKDPERAHAQGDCHRFFQLTGHALKIQDLIVCDKCFNHIHPAHKGHADNVVDWRSPAGTLSLRVEVKACRPDKSDPGGGRFDFTQLDDDQIRWLDLWQKLNETPNQAWVWLQMGAESVVSKSPYRRQAYLVRFGSLLTVRRLMFEHGGVGNLPLNIEQASTRKLTALYKLYAERLLRNWRMEYQGKENWWAPRQHPIWSLLRTPFYEYSSAVQRAEQYTQPD